MIEIEKIAENIKTDAIKTPLIVFDLETIRKNYRMLEECFNKRYIEHKIFYAVKSNPELNILRELYRMNAGFEINSIGEMNKILDIHKNEDLSNVCINSNPVKDIEELEKMYANGVKHFAFDSIDEIKKLAFAAPGSSVYLRINSSNEGSTFALNKKFGVDPKEGIDLLFKAKEYNLKPIGLTFHVGSECNNLDNWKNGLRIIREISNETRKRNMFLNIVNIGGGFPVEYCKKALDIETIAETVAKEIEQFHNLPIELWLEPGRYICATSAYTICKITGVKPENKTAYLNASVFNLFMETLQDNTFCYKCEVLDKKSNAYTEWKLYGNTCDGTDVISYKQNLPEDIKTGDYLLFKNTGAYTTAYASAFNGIKKPEALFLNQHSEKNIVSNREKIESIN